MQQLQASAKMIRVATESIVQGAICKWTAMRMVFPLKSDIDSFPNGMAVNLIFFDTSATQAIPWTHFTLEAEADSFADALDDFRAIAGG